MERMEEVLTREESIWKVELKRGKPEDRKVVFYTQRVVNYEPCVHGYEQEKKENVEVMVRCEREKEDALCDGE